MIPLEGIEKRFWKKVDKSEDCWNWIAFKHKGYGRFNINGKIYEAHRISYALHNGIIPEKMHVLHKCDNPACVNPNHLILGTHRDNMKDMFIKNRNAKGEKVSNPGESNVNSILTEKDVKYIRQVIPSGKVKISQLARKFNVSWTTIKYALVGKSWKHI